MNVFRNHHEKIQPFRQRVEQRLGRQPAGALAQPCHSRHQLARLARLAAEGQLALRRLQRIPQRGLGFRCALA
jgi:hypothetical protein